MSLDFSQIYTRVLMNLPERCLAFVKSKTNLANGKFYFLRIEDSIHQHAIKTGDLSLQKEQIENTPQEGHSVEKFQDLIRNFDLDKMGQVELHSFTFSDRYWVFDGMHRLAILCAKGQVVPLQNIKIVLRESVEDELKAALRKTTEEHQFNGWNNRRTEFGQHSFDIGNFHVKAQRNPTQRLTKIRPYYDFTGKQVLDLGCNSGGMLIHIPEVGRSFGLDLSADCIAAANLFKKYLRQIPQISFVEANLDTLDIVQFCKDREFTPDITFLLSIGSWCKWRQTQEAAWAVSKAVLLETNNDHEGAPQLKFFEERGANIQMVSDTSDDDCAGNQGRKTQLITKPT